MKKTNNEMTGLASPKTPKSPLSQADKKALEAKRITENVGHGFTKSKLRDEERYDGPQGQPHDTEYLRRVQTDDGRWSVGEMEPKQPRAAGGHFITKQALDTMPDDVPQPQGKALRSKGRPKETKAPVSVAQHNYDPTIHMFNSQ